MNLLKILFHEIIVAEKVYEEVVLQGEGGPGSEEVRNAEWIKRKTVSNHSAVKKSAS